MARRVVCFGVCWVCGVFGAWGVGGVRFFFRISFGLLEQFFGMVEG